VSRNSAYIARLLILAGLASVAIFNDWEVAGVALLVLVALAT
jgi:hypothetical protein